MKDLLDMLQVSVEELAEGLETGAVDVVDVIQGEVEPSLNKLMIFISTEAQTLTAEIKEAMIDHQEALTGRDRVDLSERVACMGEAIDKFAASLGRSRIWAKVYRTAMPVVSIWRDQENEVVGTPIKRNVQAGDIQARKCSIGSMEMDDGVTAVLMVSDGVKKPSTAENSTHLNRLEFLIDLPKLLAKGLSGSTSVGLDCRDIIRQTSGILIELDKTAKMMRSLGINNSRLGVYDQWQKYFEPEVRASLKPEDNPNALIEIGGWA